MRAPGASTIDSVDLVEGGLRDALEQRDALAQGRLEVELAAHRRLGDAGDLDLLAGVGGEHLDDLALDEGGVDVHHDQPDAAAVEGVALHGEVDALPDGLDREERSQGLGRRAGDVQLDGGDGVARHPLDLVDVGARVGDPARDRGHRRGLERVADDRDVGALAAPAAVVARAAVHLDAHVEVGGGALDGVAQLLPVPRRGDEDAEHQPTSEHDLLDVEDLDAGCGERGEDR